MAWMSDVWTQFYLTAEYAVLMRNGTLAKHHRSGASVLLRAAKGASFNMPGVD